MVIHQSHARRRKGTITKRPLLYGFCAVVEGNRLMNLNDSQLQLLYLHVRICRAWRGGERKAAAPTVGLLSQVLGCFVWRGFIDSIGNGFFIRTCITTIWYRFQEVSAQTAWKFNWQRLSKAIALTLWIQCILFIRARSSAVALLTFELLASWSLHFNRQNDS